MDIGPNGNNERLPVKKNIPLAKIRKKADWLLGSN